MRRTRGLDGVPSRAGSGSAGTWTGLPWTGEILRCARARTDTTERCARPAPTSILALAIQAPSILPYGGLPKTVAARVRRHEARSGPDRRTGITTDR